MVKRRNELCSMARRYASAANGPSGRCYGDPVRVALATDHAGLPLKEPIADWLRAAGHEVVDFGVDSTEPIDYPDVIAPAARAVAAGNCERAVVLGGSGTGEQIVAN